MRRRTLLWIAFASLLSASPAAAQRRKSSGAHRGIPCGNSYISADKVCHKDTPPSAAPTAAADTVHAVRPTQLAAPSSGLPLAATDAPPAYSVAAPPPFVTSLQPFVGAIVSFRNSPMDEKWQREMVLSEITSDHLVVMGSGHVMRIPLAAIAFTDVEAGNTSRITVVFRK